MEGSSSSKLKTGTQKGWDQKLRKNEGGELMVNLKDKYIVFRPMCPSITKEELITTTSTAGHHKTNRYQTKLSVIALKIILSSKLTASAHDTAIINPKIFESSDSLRSLHFLTFLPFYIPYTFMEKLPVCKYWSRKIRFQWSPKTKSKSLPIRNSCWNEMMSGIALD